MVTPLLLGILAVAALHLAGIEAQPPPPPSSDVTTPATTIPTTTRDACSALLSNTLYCMSLVDDCSQLLCTTEDTTMAINILPCASPPSLLLVTSQSGREIDEHVFSHTETLLIAVPSGILSLNVTMDLSSDQDALTLEVITTTPASPSPTVLVSRTTVPLDKSQCQLPLTTIHPPPPFTDATPPSSPSSPNTGTAVHAQTCQALQSIAGQQCEVVDSCGALDCNFLNQFQAKITIKPCNSPPAVGVVVRNAIGTVIVDEVLTSSRVQPIEVGGLTLFTLIVNITHTRDPDAMSLKVYIHSRLGDQVVIPETVIPIDRSGCSLYTTPIPQHPPPTSSSPWSRGSTPKTCQALQQIESTVSFACSTNVACTSILCDIQVAQLKLTVEPCLSPPTIGVRLTTVDGTVLFDDSLTRSRIQDVNIRGIVVMRVNMTIRHVPNALYLKIDVIPTFGGAPYNVIPETKIPIDQCDCPGITCPDPTQKNEGRVVKIAVSVSVVGVFLLVIVMVVLVIVGVVCFKKKRNSSYSFQRVTFENNDQLDEENE